MKEKSLPIGIVLAVFTGAFSLIYSSKSLAGKVLTGVVIYASFLVIVSIDYSFPTSNITLNPDIANPLFFIGSFLFHLYSIELQGKIIKSGSDDKKLLLDSIDGPLISTLIVLVLLVIIELFTKSNILSNNEFAFYLVAVIISSVFAYLPERKSN